MTHCLVPGASGLGCIRTRVIELDFVFSIHSFIHLCIHSQDLVFNHSSVSQPWATYLLLILSHGKDTCYTRTGLIYYIYPHSDILGRPPL